MTNKTKAKIALAATGAICGILAGTSSSPVRSMVAVLCAMAGVAYYTDLLDKDRYEDEVVLNTKESVNCKISTFNRDGKVIIKTERDDGIAHETAITKETAYAMSNNLLIIANEV